ncbi:MAG: hypothetical protein IT448_11735, partial [Phycisphaerales bacterium]|nr:hypothetical protein [Phycisphaerales bacterium]
NLADGLLSVAMCLAARESCFLKTFQNIPPVNEMSKYYQGRPEVSALTHYDDSAIKAERSG